MAQQGRSILRNLSLMTLSVGATMVISLALKMMMPRVFGAEAMGTFYFAESFAKLFFTFLPLGLATYISRTLPARPEHTREILPTLLLLQMATALVIGLIFFGALLWQGRDQQTVLTTLLMGGYAAVVVFQTGIMQNIFVALDQVKLISRLNVVTKIILVGGSLSILAFYPSLIAIAAMHFIAELIGLIFLILRARQQHFLEGPAEIRHAKTMLKVSLPFYLAGVLNGVYAEIDTTMLAQFSTALEVGYFGSAFKLIGVFMLLVPIVQSAITPSLSEAYARNNGTFEPMVRQMLHLMFICCLHLSLGLTLFGDIIAQILYGNGFEPSYRILCFLTPVLTMIYLNTFVGTCHHLVSSGNKLSFIFVTGIIVNVCLDWLAIPYGQKHFGDGGAGLAVTFATFLCETYSFLAMILLFPYRLMSRRVIWSLFIIILPSWIAMAFFSELIQLKIWQRIVLYLLTPVYALATGLVSRNDIRFAWNWIQRKRSERKKGQGDHA